MIVDYSNGNVITPSAVKLDSWLASWLNLYGTNLAETTKAGYTEKIKNCISPQLGKLTLNSLNANAVQSWVNALSSKGSSLKTIRNAYNILNDTLKKAVVLGMIAKNPCVGIVLPKLVKPTTNVYDTEEIRLAIKSAEGTDMYLILLLLLTVGR